jgi:hypothetical protein
LSKARGAAATLKPPVAGSDPMRRALLAAAVLALALPTPALADLDGHEVLADPAADMGLFPTADEVQAAVNAAAGNPWVTVHSLGASEDGRPITVLEITNPASTVPRGDRVVTLLETQQHGNEPAGTGAALPLLSDLLAGKHPADLLDNQVLLLLPMTNPDGATADQRANSKGVDINRDHVGLETSEARALHEVLKRWDVHVAIDHHEYSGTGPGSPVPVRTYDFDLTLMYPNHGNVREPTAAASKELDYDVLWPAAQAAGYTVGDYGVTTVAGVPVPEVQGVDTTARAGGPDPGILRNSFGLNNVAGLLAETFVSPQPDNPFQSAERRIAIHRLVMETTLQWAHDNAARLVAAKRESERLNAEEPMADYLEGDLAGPLAAAYRTADTPDVAAVFAGHGLPAGIPTDGGIVHAVAGEPRGGLVAAILHPQSSRHVADAQPADLPALADTGASAGVKDSPAATPLLVLAALALAAAVVRRQK